MSDIADLSGPIPIYPRRGVYPVVPPATKNDRPIKLAIVYPVCYHYRVPLFRTLSDHPSLRVKLFVGTGVPGTKVVNARHTDGLDICKMWTLRKQVRSSGRQQSLLFNPTVAYQLFRWKPDVIMLLGGEIFTNAMALSYAKLFRIPVIWWTLGQIRKRQFSGFGRIYRRLAQYLERKCDIYLGYSSVAMHYFKLRGYPLERCYNLVNVVDTDRVFQQIASTRDQTEALREKLGLKHKHVLLFVGALEESKRVDRLLRALAAIKDDFENAMLLIVGGGVERANLESLTEELDLTNRVRFTGAVLDGVSAYFQLADLLVLPGTGGLAISEAMAHGIPVITSIGDGCEVDLLQDGNSGHILLDNDVESLKDTLRTYLSAPDRLRELGINARATIENQHNIARYINEMLAGIFAAYQLRNPAP